MKQLVLTLLVLVTIGGCCGGGGIQPYGRFALQPIPDANQSYSATMTRLGQLPQDVGCVARGGAQVIASAPGGSSVTFQFRVYNSSNCSGEPCSTPSVTRIAQAGQTEDITVSGCLGEWR